jgi:hypothetical protein
LTLSEFKKLLVSGLKEITGIESGTLTDIITAAMPKLLKTSPVKVGCDNILQITGSSIRGVGNMYFCEVTCGGEHEVMVRTILYYDGGIKLYVPTVGNTFCVDHMCAYGSCDCNYDPYVEVDDLLMDEDISDAFKVKHTQKVSSYASTSDRDLIEEARDMYYTLFIEGRTEYYSEGIEVTNEERYNSIYRELTTRGYTPYRSIDFKRGGRV